AQTPPSQRQAPGLQWLLATYVPPNVKDCPIANFCFDHNLFFSVMLTQINAELWPDRPLRLLEDRGLSTAWSLP
ncbi:MAG TPA: hypothetical protein VIG56_07625, partial [Pseudolabrys sp.]